MDPISRDGPIYLALIISSKNLIQSALSTPSEARFLDSSWWSEEESFLIKGFGSILLDELLQLLQVFPCLLCYDGAGSIHCTWADSSTKFHHYTSCFGSKVAI